MMSPAEVEGSVRRATRGRTAESRGGEGVGGGESRAQPAGLDRGTGEPPSYAKMHVFNIREVGERLLHGNLNPLRMREGNPEPTVL